LERNLQTIREVETVRWKPKHLALILTISLFLTLIPNVYAHTITVPPTAHFGFGTGDYINFDAEQTFGTVYRENGMWYFDNYGLQVENANLTVSKYFTDNQLNFILTAPSSTISTTKVYCDGKGKPVTLTGASSWSYNIATKIATITVTHSSSQEVTLDWAPLAPTPRGEFYLAFETDESFQIQIQNSPNLFIIFTISSGTLYGNGSLETTTTNGTLLIEPSTTGILTITYPTSVTLTVNGIAYSSPIPYTSSDTLTIFWTYTLYTLALTSTPTQVSFTINGSEGWYTPYSRSLINGIYQVVFPYSFTRNNLTWTFKWWNDTGSSNQIRTINLQSNTYLAVTYIVGFQPTELHPTFAYEMSGYVAESERVILMDHSIHKNYGTSGSTSTAPSMKLGAVGQALYFDGENDYIEIPNHAESNQLSTAFVLTMWICLSQKDVNQTIIYKQDEYQIYIDDTNKLGFGVKDDYLGWVNILSTTTLVLETWYHVMAIYNSTHVRLRLNNVEENIQVTSGKFTVTSNPLYLGTKGLSYNNGFMGMIDDLLGFKRQLSESELRMIYSAPFKIEPPPTYDFTSGSGDYGFYGDYFETPWANGTVSDSWVKTEHYLYGFAKFRSKVTLEFESYSSNDNIEWNFSFYKRGNPQVTFGLKLVSYMYLGADLWLEALWYKNGVFVTSDHFAFNASATKYYLQVDGWNDPSGQFGLRIVVYDEKHKALAGNELVPSDDKGYREHFFDYEDSDGVIRNLAWFDPTVKTTITLNAKDGFLAILEHESFPFLILAAILVISAIGIGSVYYLASTGNPIAKWIVDSVFQPIIDFLSSLAGQIATALAPIGDWIVTSLISAAYPLLDAIVYAANIIAQALIASLDTMFGWFGWENGFTQILQVINSIFALVPGAISSFVSIMTVAATVFIGSFLQILDVFASAIMTAATIVDWIGWMWIQLYPYWGWVPEVFTKLLPLLFVFYVLWVLSPAIDKGNIHGSRQRIDDTVGLMWRVVNGLLHIVDLLINTIYRVTEMIPVVE